MTNTPVEKCECEKPLTKGNLIRPYCHLCGLRVIEPPISQSVVEWEKEFWSKFNIAYVSKKGFASLGIEIVDFITHLLSRQAENIRGEVEGMEMKVPTNRLMDVAMALRDPKTLSEDEKRQQESRDFALKRDHIICGAHNHCLTDTLALLGKYIKK